MPQIRDSKPAVLHIDASPEARALVAIWLKRSRTVRLLGAADSIAAGLDVCRRLRPGILLLDAALPDGDSLLELDAFLGLPSKPKVIMYTAWNKPAFLQISRRKPLHGVVWKTGESKELLSALATIASGGKYHTQSYLMEQQNFSSSPRAFDRFLSAGQIALLRLSGRGLGDEVICEKQGITASTLKTHWRNIRAKLGLPGREALRSWIAEHGFDFRSH